MRSLITAAAMLLSTAAYADWKDAALEEIRAEPQVVEAMFQNGGRTLWVSMRDDGSPRDGYANYLCLVMSDAGLPAGNRVRIRIWDAAVMRDELRQIGEGSCEIGS